MRTHAFADCVFRPCTDVYSAGAAKVVYPVSFCPAAEPGIYPLKISKSLNGKPLFIALSLGFPGLSLLPFFFVPPCAEKTRCRYLAPPEDHPFANAAEFHLSLQLHEDMKR
jgi:hypothetical protein